MAYRKEKKKTVSFYFKVQEDDGVIENPIRSTLVKL